MTQLSTSKGNQVPSPWRVLLAIEQRLLADVVKLALNHGTFVTRTAQDVEQAVAMLRTWQPHLTLVDLDVGRGQLLDQLAEAAQRIPMIALTRRGDLETKLTAFKRGIDDFLTVPFSPEELIARTLTVMRRTYQAPVDFLPTIQLGELEIDILHHRVRVGHSELHLTAIEENLLYLLAANAERVLTRDEILDALWGADYVPDSNLVDRHIGNLRAKLQDDWHRPRYIATVPGCGYRFVPMTSDEGPTSRSS